MNRGSAGDPTPDAAAAESASMRPRFMNRGSFAGVLAGAREVGASMRPRFMNRGSGFDDDQCLQLYSLQ